MEEKELSKFDLKVFLKESNKIERIDIVTKEEVRVAQKFLDNDDLFVTDIEEYVLETAGDTATLRRALYQNVRIGSHLPPAGGVHIETSLSSLLRDIEEGESTPYQIHQRYEALHPFMDGNGRSGRLLWLWHMRQSRAVIYNSSFLHTWYYQSLAESR